MSWLLEWRDWIFQRRSRRWREQLIDQIARHCASALRSTAPCLATPCAAACTMTACSSEACSPALLRGYWRARGRSIIADYIVGVRRENEALAEALASVAELSLERAIEAAAALAVADERPWRLSAAA